MTVSRARAACLLASVAKPSAIRSSQFWATAFRHRSNPRSEWPITVQGTPWPIISVASQEPMVPWSHKLRSVLSCATSHHSPAVRQTDRLASQGSPVLGQKYQGIGHILHGGEHAVHCVPQHDVFHDLFFGDAQGGCLLRDLLFHQGCLDKAGADDVGMDAVFSTLPGDGLGKSGNTVLDEVVRLLQLGANECLDRAR